MKLIITRHGETEDNKAGIIQEHLPGKLSNLGIDQAQKIALRLKDEKIDYIYSSDLARSSDTTKEIIKHHPGVPVEFVKALREKFLGAWQGKHKTDLGFSKDKSIKAMYPDDAETSEEVFERASNFFNELFSKHPSDTVLCVGHNGINKALVSVITGKKPEEINAVANQKNTSVCIFEIDKDKNYQILAFNCVRHLD